jgi:hypothetical protein
MVSAMCDESCSYCCSMNLIRLSFNTYLTFFLLLSESYFVDLIAKLHSMIFSRVSSDVTTIFGIFFPSLQCSFS